MKNTPKRPDDVRAMGDEDLLRYVRSSEGVTPLINELAVRLESFVEIFGELTLSKGDFSGWGEDGTDT